MKATQLDRVQQAIRAEPLDPAAILTALQIMNDFLESGRPAGLLLQDVQDSRIARDLFNRAVRRVVSVYETIYASIIEDPSAFAEVLKAFSLPPVAEFEKKLRLHASFLRL